MKTPIDIVRGKIVDVDEHGVMTIKAKYDDWRTMLRRDYCRKYPSQSQRRKRSR